MTPMTPQPHTPSLTRKLSATLEDVVLFHQQGARLDVALIRALLARQRVLVLPRVESHEITDLGDGQARVELALRVSLVDGESEARLDSRWVGRAEGPRDEALEAAITRTLEDFLLKTFLALPEHQEQLTLFRAPREEHDQEQPSAPEREHEQAQDPTDSAIRRRPHDAVEASPAAGLPHTEREPRPAPDTWTPPRGRTPHLAEPPSLDTEPLVDAEDLCAADVNPTAWKAANALWRALVSAVVSHDIMDQLEDAIEAQHGVDSWRKLTPDLIRESCHQLRKRSPMPSDVRRISDREEYILAHLPAIPDGSSLERTRREIDRLIEEVADATTCEAFMTMYLQRLGVRALADVPGRALMALVRKLRRLHGEDRALFIQGALEPMVLH